MKQCALELIITYLLFTVGSCDMQHLTQFNMETINIKSASGKTHRSKKLLIQSTINKSAGEVWRLHLNSETYLKIMSPEARLIPLRAADIPEKWVEGQSNHFKLRMYGIIPYGKHHIQWETIDMENKTIQTKEWGFTVPLWANKITIRQLTDSTCIIEDELIIQAGIINGIVAQYAKSLFKAKHKRIRNYKTD